MWLEKKTTAHTFLRNFLILSLPLLVGSRTMQTAVGVFGGEGYTNGADVPPLMVANAGNSNRPAISSFYCPPFMAVESCREDLIKVDADILWRPDVREANEEIAARRMGFLN